MKSKFNQICNSILNEQSNEGAFGDSSNLPKTIVADVSVRCEIKLKRGEEFEEAVTTVMSLIEKRSKGKVTFGDCEAEPYEDNAHGGPFVMSGAINCTGVEITAGDAEEAEEVITEIFEAFAAKNSKKMQISEIIVEPYDDPTQEEDEDEEGDDWNE